jgi:hypothetical protein
VELIDVSADEFKAINHHKYMQSPESILANISSPMNALLFEFMGKLIDELMLSYTKNVI